MTRLRRQRLVVPSESDVVLAPDLRPFFLLDAALRAARHVVVNQVSR